jgi:hypothetical protein
MLSKDQKSKNAIKAINDMESVEAVQTYIAGDDRPDVLDAARVQIEFIEKTSPSPQPSPTGSEGDTSAQTSAPEVPPSAAIASGAGDPLKQGEQSGPITRETADFKGGIQAVKSYVTGSDIVAAIDKEDERKAALQASTAEMVTGQDVIASIDAADEKRARAAERKAAEDAAALKAGTVVKDYVTAEDAIRQMRAEGKKI